MDSVIDWRNDQRVFGHRTHHWSQISVLRKIQKRVRLQCIIRSGLDSVRCSTPRSSRTYNGGCSRLDLNFLVRRFKLGFINHQLSNIHKKPRLSLYPRVGILQRYNCSACLGKVVQNSFKRVDSRPLLPGSGQQCICQDCCW